MIIAARLLICRWWMRSQAAALRLQYICKDFLDNRDHTHTSSGYTEPAPHFQQNCGLGVRKARGGKFQIWNILLKHFCNSAKDLQFLTSNFFPITAWSMCSSEKHSNHVKDSWSKSLLNFQLVSQISLLSPVLPFLSCNSKLLTPVYLLSNTSAHLLVSHLSVIFHFTLMFSIFLDSWAPLCYPLNKKIN